MRRRNDRALEQALRRSRSEPPPDFLRALADEIREEIRGGRSARVRSLSIGLAVALTAILVAALGAAGVASSATGLLLDAVSLSTQEEVQVATNTPAQDQYACNSGRGNLSETESGDHQTDSTTLVNPHEGETGPGPYPTDDCDPGKSGPQDRGGD